MYYVYLIQSINNSTKTYIGFTNNIKERLKKHNEGASIYTSDFRPWKLISFVGFDEEAKVLSFEKYLKSGSGRSFAKRHF